MPKNDSQKGAVEISTFAGMAIIAAVVAVLSTIAVIKYREMPNVTAPVAVITPELMSSATPTPIVDNQTINLKTYNDNLTGLEFKYPSSVVLGETTSPLTIFTDNINNFDEPLGYTTNELLKDRAALKNNSENNAIRSGSNNKANILNIQGAIGKEFTTLGLLDHCDIRFTRQVVIYKDDYVIRINWEADDSAGIIKNNPNYFIVDDANCGGELVWKDSDNFYNDLVFGKTDAISQKWFKDFDQILSTFKFTK